MSSALQISRISFLLLLVLAAASPRVCAAQAPAKKSKPTPLKSEVTTTTVGGRKMTTIIVDLQNAPNNMEPVAEPRNLRIDDRDQVRFRIRNLSPFDVCSRSGVTTPIIDTPPIESLVTTISGLGGIAASSSQRANEQTIAAYGMTLNEKAYQFQKQFNLTKQDEERNKTPGCPLHLDSEYKAFEKAYVQFLADAPKLIGIPDSGTVACPAKDLASTKIKLVPGVPSSSDANPPGARVLYVEHPQQKPTQFDLACEIDQESRDLVAFAARDFRGTNMAEFRVATNPDFDPVRAMYIRPIATVEPAAELQALIDQMKRYADYLHKKYDPQPVAATGDSAPLPAIPGVLSAAPATIHFSKPDEPQKIALTSGGEAGSFTATPLSDSGWLQLARTGDANPRITPVTGITPNHGSYPLLVTVDREILDGKTHYGSILIKGTGKARGTTIITVVVAPPDTDKESCEHRALRQIDTQLDEANAMFSIVTDGNKNLQTSQAALKTSFMALQKLEDDFIRRRDVLMSVHTVQNSKNQPILEQWIDLGTDRKVTSTGDLSCVSSTTPPIPTTSNIHYSLSYQDIPNWTASVGFLVSFQPNQIIGIGNVSNTSTTPPTNTQYFTATSRTPVQLFPMAYLNYRLLGGQRQYGRTREDQLVETINASFGFGVNPNTGTNQPEFFGGLAIGWNRLLLHPGVHIGHTESLGGGYTFASPVPSTLTAAPIAWSYHYKFSIGFSVRIAPY